MLKSMWELKEIRKSIFVNPSRPIWPIPLFWPIEHTFAFKFTTSSIVNNLFWPGILQNVNVTSVNESYTKSSFNFFLHLLHQAQYAIRLTGWFWSYLTSSTRAVHHVWNIWSRWLDTNWAKSFWRVYGKVQLNGSSIDAIWRDWRLKK